jgi:hypothetical protein
MKAIFLFFFFLLAFNSKSQGHLTGQFTTDLGEIIVKKSQFKDIIFEFKVKNTGDKLIKIDDVKVSCGCQESDENNIQSIGVGKTGTIKIIVKTKKVYNDNDKKEIVEYDKPVILMTENGRKRKYQLNTKATFRFVN